MKNFHLDGSDVLDKCSGFDEEAVKVGDAGED